MAPPITDVSPESSPAIKIPREGPAYAEWRQTGKLPAAKPKAESTPAKETPAEGEKPAENPAPASETGKSQEKKPRDSAAARLSELLEDLRKAGMTPNELKTFKREQQKTEQAAESGKPQAAEQTGKPAELKPPAKPKQEDFKTYDEYDAAKDKYYEDLADFKTAKAIEKYQQDQQRNAAQQSVHEKMTEAKGRYGDEAVGIISATARAFTGDQQIPDAIKSLLDSSPVWTDLLYTLGSKPADLDSFIQLSKTDPMGAIRKVALMEELVKQELAKGSKKPAADDAENSGAGSERDESGKFKKAAPEKQESNAPPPPKEVSGRGTPPPDEVDRAVKTSDFASFKRAQNAKDLARRRG
jgi:hypothetical protein